MLNRVIAVAAIVMAVCAAFAVGRISTSPRSTASSGDNKAYEPLNLTPATVNGAPVLPPSSKQPFGLQGEADPEDTKPAIPAPTPITNSTSGDSPVDMVRQFTKCRFESDPEQGFWDAKKLCSKSTQSELVYLFNFQQMFKGNYRDDVRKFNFNSASIEKLHETAQRAYVRYELVNAYQASDRWWVYVQLVKEDRHWKVHATFSHFLYDENKRKGEL